MIHNRLANRIENEKKEERAYTYIRGRFSFKHLRAPNIFRDFIAKTVRGLAYFRGQINFSTVFGAVIISAGLALSR